MSREWMIRKDGIGEPHYCDYYCADKCRPVVVIDPEDAEQVRAIRDLVCSLAGTDPSDFPAEWRVRNALREFADPKPRIEEPTGLGAVVRDVEGILWTRVEAGEAQTRNPWYPADAADFQPDEWHNLCAVEVLSEGVTE